MSIRSTILLSISCTLVVFLAVLARVGTAGMAHYQREMSGHIYADLLQEGADSFLDVTHQFCALWENLPPAVRTGDPVQDVAPYFIESASTHYLFFDGEGAPMGSTAIAPALSPLLTPAVLEAFLAEARAGGPDEMTIDNYQAVLDGEGVSPAIAHVHAYPESNLILGMGKTQSLMGIRLASLSDIAGATFRRLARLGGLIYLLLAAATLSVAWLALQFLFFRPLVRTLLVDADAEKTAGITWPQCRAYASRLRTTTAEMERVRERLEREVEVRFQAEEERDLLRNSRDAARRRFEAEVRERSAVEVQEAQSELMRREARVLHRHLAAPLEEANKQLAGQDIDGAQRAIERCLTVVRGLSGGEHELPHAPQRLALQPWLEEVVSDFRATHPVTIQTNIHNGVHVNIDRHSLRHAIEFVLENAFQITPEDTSIAVDATRADDRVEIRVVDHGAGIPGDARAHILVPFYSLREDGDGLGLAITHSVVRQHGGRLDIRTETGKGTAVIITLPLAG